MVVWAQTPLAGGAGNDIYVIDNAGDLVVEAADGGLNDTVVSTISVNLGGTLESAYLLGTGSNSVTGNAAANLIYGNTGSNLLSGGAGNDVLVGFRDVASAGLAAPVAYGAVDGADTLDGGGGDEILDGGAGADFLIGGTGSDYYIVDQAGDVVQEGDLTAQGGWDTVESSVSFVLDGSANTAGVEALVMTGSAYQGRGNALSNSITGNDVGNYIHGLDGDDTIFAFDGADTVLAGNGDDVMYGDLGDDTPSGGIGNDYLDGGEGDDLLAGAVGSDVYSFSGDFGLDLVSNSATTYATDNDDIVFTDLSRDQLAFQRSGDDLLINQINSANSVRVYRCFYNVSYQVDQIQTLGDGAVIDAGSVAALVSSMVTFAPQAALSMPTGLPTTQSAPLSIA